jgi:molybdopterin-guanine dinucleotide biosynthesis protein A
LQHVVDTVRAVCDRVRVLAPVEDEARGELPGAGSNIEIVHDLTPFQGPLEAIARAWPERGACEFVFVVAGDLPGITPVVLQTCQRRLLQGGSAFDGAIVRREGRLQPLTACYRWRAGSAFHEMVRRGEKRLMPVLFTLHLVEIEAEHEGWPQWWTRPVHTSHDYEAWLHENEVKS